MPRKGENIRKRKDGRWEGRYKRGVKENGSADYGSVYAKTYKEVKEKLLLAKENSKIICDTTKNEKRFSDILYLWAKTNKIRLKGASEHRYDYLIRTHIVPELGGLKMSQINASSINTFLMNKLTNGRLDGKGGLSASYVSSIMVIVKSAINFAVAEEICQPLKTPIYKPQMIKNDPAVLSSEQLTIIELQIKKELNSTTIGVMLSLYTGLRIGEICALSWDDIDMENQVIHVRHTIARIKNESFDSKTKLIIDEPKTKSSKRDIPIPSAVMETLEQYKKISASKYIVSDSETFISPRTYEYRYHRFLDVCGIKSVNYHSLRHTFASRCVEVGVDIKSLSEILGHQDSSITLNTYVHSSMTQKRLQMDKLRSALAV